MMTIRQLGQCDLSAAAELHLLAFPEAAISLVGYEAARRFYQSLLFGPHDQVGIGAYSDGRLVGYLCGGRAIGAELHFLRQHAGYLAMHVLLHPSIMFRARLFHRVVLGLRILTKTNVSGTSVGIPSAELLRDSFGIQAIAVDPRCRRQGIGRLLMNSGEAWARQRGFKKMNLSVHANNLEAIGFYESIGWQKWTKNNKWGGFMLRDLN